CKLSNKYFARCIVYSVCLSLGDDMLVVNVESSSLSLHDALPIFPMPVERPATSANGCRHPSRERNPASPRADQFSSARGDAGFRDRKSTRLNSSHLVISYAVFRLKKKKPVRYRQCDHLRIDPFH